MSLWRQILLCSDQNMKKRRTLYHYTFLQAIQIWNKNKKILIFKIWLCYEKSATLGLFSNRNFFFNLIFSTYFLFRIQISNFLGGGRFPNMNLFNDDHPYYILFDISSILEHAMRQNIYWIYWIFFLCHSYYAIRGSVDSQIHPHMTRRIWTGHLLADT